jgi:hypothetical protein
VTITLRVRKRLRVAATALVAVGGAATLLPQLAFAEDHRPSSVTALAAAVPSPVAAHPTHTTPGPEATLLVAPTTVPAAAPTTAPTTPPAAAPTVVPPPAAAPKATAKSTTKAPAAPKTATTKAAAPPAAAAVKAPAAPALTLCSGDGWEVRRGQAALASLRPAQASGYSLTFLPGQSTFLGLTKPALKAVEVYVRSCSAESDALLRHVVAHELGHAWDKSHLSAADHADWLAARGIPGDTPWQGCSRCTDFATPAGDFAEVYAQWRAGESSNRSQLAGAPGPAELNALAARFFGA